MFKLRILLVLTLMVGIAEQVKSQAEVQNPTFPFWKVNGNAGTVDGTNFIGTTDDVAFNVRVNNAAAGRLDSRGNTYLGSSAGNNSLVPYSNVAVGRAALFNNTSRSNLVAIGDSALFNNGTGAVLSTEGIRNVAVGSKALFDNTIGSRNVAVGMFALTDNTSGSNNTAVGLSALSTNLTGGANTAFGSTALTRVSTGFGNSAFGMVAGALVTTGNRNTLIGDSSDVLVNSISAATALGYFSKVSFSNTLILGDTVLRPNVGIGVTAVGKTLAGTRFEIASEAANSNLLFRYSGTQSPSFSFQSSSGTLAARTAVSATATLGRIDFYGHDGTTFDPAGAMSVEVDSTVNTGIVPSKINFFTQSGAGVLVERMRIDKDGDVGIGQGTNVNTKLYVNGGVTIEPRDSIILTVDNQLVQVGNESYLRIGSNNTDVTTRTLCLSDGVNIGQILVISGAYTNPNLFGVGPTPFIGFPDTNISGNFSSTIFSAGDTAVFIWDGRDWLLISQNN